MFTNFTLHTDGSGYWSDKTKSVRVTRIEIDLPDRLYSEKLYGEMKVFFDLTTWRVPKDGLIYTDNLWLSELRDALYCLGFSKIAVEAFDYSEQGMQGQNYVSLDVAEPFIREFYGKDFDTIMSSIQTECA